MDRLFAFGFRGIAIAYAVVVGTVTVPLVAHDLFHKCDRCGKGCQPHVLVEKTVMMPKCVIEMRVESCVVHNCEEREEKYTAFVVKPETKPLKKDCCYLASEVKEKKIELTQPKLVDVETVKVLNIKVPQTEQVEKTFQREVCTECGLACVECTCVCERTRMVEDVCVQPGCDKQLIFEKTTKDIFYCVKTPTKQTIDLGEETVMKLVPVEKTRKVKVNVPKIEKRMVEVEVQKMVPVKVLCCEECAKKHHR